MSLGDSTIAGFSFTFAALSATCSIGVPSMAIAGVFCFRNSTDLRVSPTGVCELALDLSMPLSALCTAFERFFVEPTRRFFKSCSDELIASTRRSTRSSVGEERLDDSRALRRRSTVAVVSLRSLDSTGRLGEPLF